MTGPFDTPDLPHAVALHRRGALPAVVPYDVVTLTHDARRLRRRRLVTAHDEGFFIDLPQIERVAQGDCFELADGRLVEVIAAEEPLAQITGDLTRLAWHIGNRHAPCQIEPNRLLIRRDPVLEEALAYLGAGIAEVSEPFLPEDDGHIGVHAPGHDRLPHPPPEADPAAAEPNRREAQVALSPRAAALPVPHVLPPGGPFDPEA